MSSLYSSRSCNSPRLSRSWSSNDVRIVCALVCKGVHHDKPLSFATKLNEGINGGHDFEDDIDVGYVEELLEYMKKYMKGALDFKDAFYRGLFFDAPAAERDERLKDDIVKEELIKASRATLYEGAKGDHSMAADDTQEDYGTPSTGSETLQPLSSPLCVPSSPIPEISNTTKPPGQAYMRGSANTGAAKEAVGAVSTQGSTPPWRSKQQPTGRINAPYEDPEKAKNIDASAGDAAHEGSERK
ncbi:hypothetical protein PG994_011724 [Apiospora phragmitis]|uniref:Uncharacterized protein n=1 Tax=Apiospora phragmitis TaxID=2905665 RepID=A0ABR1TTL4_9PEZI